MGHFRLLLALLVVVAHTVTPHSYSVIDGQVAVRLFFTVSGFYMAMILTEKYTVAKPRRLWLFYSNRALRILPLLWLAVFLEVALAIVLLRAQALPENHWFLLMEKLVHERKVPLVLSYVAAQISGFGIDSFFLISLDPDLTPCLYPGKIEGFIRGWQPLPLAHAWSISCELCFYLCSPLLNRLRSSMLSAILVLSVFASSGLGYVLPHHIATVAGSFWFPFQIGFFALGILAYRLSGLARVGPKSHEALARMFIVLVFFVCIIFYSQVTALSYKFSQVLLYGLALLGIPILFQSTAHSEWDRKIGELSYPVYLVHISVKEALLSPLAIEWVGPEFQGSAGLALTTMLVSCGVAWLMLRLVDRPINAWRQYRVTRTQAGPKS